MFMISNHFTLQEKCSHGTLYQFPEIKRNYFFMNEVQTNIAPHLPTETIYSPTTTTTALCRPSFNH